MRARFPWNINTSGPVQPNHTAKAGSAPNPRPAHAGGAQGQAGGAGVARCTYHRGYGRFVFFFLFVGRCPHFCPLPDGNHGEHFIKIAPL